MGQASDFPNKPIQIIVGWAAGGTEDLRARSLAPTLEKILGQPIVVVNKPGASGTIGFTLVKNAKPDGYTLGSASTSGVLFTPHRDPRFHDGHRQRQHRSDRLTLADFLYQEEKDEYRCPKGRVFRLRAKRIIQDGTIYRRYSHEGEGCKGCELKHRCVKGKRAKKRSNLMVPVGSVVRHKSKAMAEKVESEKGRRIYYQRMAIAEPVFANLRIMKALHPFTLRGKIKVNIQWLLYCMVHNIGKILNSGLKYAYT
jgi:hypothetical protein